MRFCGGWDTHSPPALCVTPPVRPPTLPTHLDTALCPPHPPHPPSLQAGALLALFQQLPEPFMPPLVSNLLAYSAPSGAQAAVLLSDGMTSCEWATCR